MPHLQVMSDRPSKSGTYLITIRIGAPDYLGGVMGVKEIIAQLLELEPTLVGAIVTNVERI